MIIANQYAAVALAFVHMGASEKRGLLASNPCTSAYASAVCVVASDKRRLRTSVLVVGI